MVVLEGCEVLKDMGWADSPYPCNMYCISCGSPAGFRRLKIQRTWSDGTIEVSEETHRSSCHDCERIAAAR